LKTEDHPESLIPEKINNSNVSVPSIQSNSLKIIQTDLHTNKLTFALDEHADIQKDIIFNAKKIKIKKIELYDIVDKKSIASTKEANTLAFDKPISIDLKDQSYGEHDLSVRYVLKVIYNFDNETLNKDSTESFLNLALNTTFSNYKDKEIVISNLSAKQIGYKKAKISFNINQIVPEDDKNAKRDIKIQKL